VHADPCWGFRFELDAGEGQAPAKKILSYCTDTGPCDNLVALSRNADVLITECGLLPGAPSPPSWPHLNPEMAAEAAKAAGVKKLFLTHFAANLYETKEARLQAQAAARGIFTDSTATMDGMQVEL
jgi:ribonuclease BN (tRNA processing enzyme)